MLSKKINAKLKRAFYYFGCEEVVPYNEVKDQFEKVQALPNDDEEVAARVNEHIETIENYFDTPEMKEDETRTPFAKGEPRASWDSF